jgi:hypothetical protein
MVTDATCRGSEMPGLARLLLPVFALAVGAAIVAVPGGCSKKTAPVSATVRGKVTYQGEPLADGLIVFAPDPDRGASGKPAHGELGADGSFQLIQGGEPAIQPGWYRVAIAPAPQYAPGSLRDRSPFPLDLSRPDRSGIVREVKAGLDNVFELSIELP